jgi:hypothetical protein
MKTHSCTQNVQLWSCEPPHAGEQHNHNSRALEAVEDMVPAAIYVSPTHGWQHYTLLGRGSDGWDERQLWRRVWWYAFGGSQEALFFVVQQVEEWAEGYIRESSCLSIIWTAHNLKMWHLTLKDRGIQLQAILSHTSWGNCVLGPITYVHCTE